MKKNQLAKRNDFTSVSIKPPDPNMDSAGMIEYFDRLAKAGAEISIRAALSAGWILTVEKANRAGTFVKWLSANVNCSQRTAYNYMACFDRAIANRSDVNLLTCGSEEREALIEESAKSLDSKSVTEMYVELGVCSKTPSNLGGKREGAGRKRKSDTELAEMADMATRDPTYAKDRANELVSALYAFAVAPDGFGLMETQDLKDTLASLGDVLKLAQKILTGRKGK